MLLTVIAGFRPEKQATSALPACPELTHIKCYRGWEVDEASADTLTHIRGYRSLEHEFVLQTRVTGTHSRPLPARRSSAQDAHTRRVLRHLRVSSKSSPAAAQPPAGQRAAETFRTESLLRVERSAAGAQGYLAGERSALQQAAPGGAARVAGTPGAALRAAAGGF